jgi:hypothetical protein
MNVTLKTVLLNLVFLNWSGIEAATLNPALSQLSYFVDLILRLRRVEFKYQASGCWGEDSNL